MKSVPAARFTDVKRAVETADNLVWMALQKLIEKGFIEKTEGLYRATPAGLKVLKSPELERVKVKVIVKEASRLLNPVEVDITPYIM